MGNHDYHQVPFNGFGQAAAVKNVDACKKECESNGKFSHDFCYSFHFYTGTDGEFEGDSGLCYIWNKPNYAPYGDVPGATCFVKDQKPEEAPKGAEATPAAKPATPAAKPETPAVTPEATVTKPEATETKPDAPESKPAITLKKQDGPEDVDDL